jgi:Isochorismatase family
VDLQDEPLSRFTLTLSAEQIRLSARAMAELAKVYGLPTTQTLIGVDGIDRSISEITEVLGVDGHIRTSPHSLSDPAIREALKRNERSDLVIAGLVSEVGLYHAVTGALESGYRTYIPIDLCAGLSERTERAALSQLQQDGAILTSVATISSGLMRAFNGELEQAARPFMRSRISAGFASASRQETHERIGDQG